MTRLNKRSIGVFKRLTKDRVDKAMSNYKNQKVDSHTYGRVVSINADGSYQVLLNKSATTTRCANCCTAMVGDVVHVCIKADGKCVAEGRVGGDLGGGGTIVTQYDDVSNYIAGRVFAYAGTDEPFGCLPCDGSAVSRTTYWELFDAIGTTYGAGDGSSTFNLPNIESRTIIGESDSYALGSTGGEAAHVLTAGELPAYALIASTHVAGFYENYTNPTLQPNADYANEVQFTGNVGNQPHNNMQPYIVMRYFITTGKGDPVSGINPADYVVEWGTDEETGWHYQKFASGWIDLFYSSDVTVAIQHSYNSYSYYSDSIRLEFPFALTNAVGAQASCMGGHVTRVDLEAFDNTGITVMFENPTAVTSTPQEIFVHAYGFWKEPSASGGTETIAPTIAERFDAIEADIDYLRSPDSKVLCDLSAYMSSDQTITLSEPVSEQEHGIVLVFGYYSGGAPQGYDFAYFFVPKKQVDWGVGANFSEFCEDGHFSKYLYIGDNRITGYKANNTDFSKDGVTFRNTSFVLRYVLGV